MELYSLIGLPGAGTTTQAKKLERLEQLPRIGKGTLLQKYQDLSFDNEGLLTDQDTLEATEIRQALSKGKPIPETTYIEMLACYIDQHDDYPVILDGIPDSVEHARMIDEERIPDLDTVFYLHVEDTEKLYKRMQRRNGYKDDEQIIRDRLEDEQAMMQEIRNHYRHHETTDIVYIDGSKNHNMVYHDLLEELSTQRGS